MAWQGSRARAANGRVDVRCAASVAAVRGEDAGQAFGHQGTEEGEAGANDADV